jgi:hypothetical protein
VLLPLIFCLQNRHSLSKPLKVLSYYLYLSVAVEIWTVTYYYLHIPNLAVINLYNGLEFIFFSLFFYTLYKSYWFKRLVLLIILLVLGYFIYIFKVLESIQLLNLHLCLLYAALAVMYIILYGVQLLRTLETKELSSSPVFIICLALLLYSFGNVYIFTFAQHFVDTQKLPHETLSRLYYLVLILFRVLMGLAYWNVGQLSKKV